ncbi:unnamed protein product [Pocillopora meandrina]|uniref:Uncharacterized protein n=1 Tax=Pocillopora meandrina TaxID=46732 RepID=A0AAU9WE33_9CNID|nr:unnamed protein product [Pocillopora meandrina]
MFQQAVKNDWKAIIDNKSKFLLAHSSSGHKHSLRGEDIKNFPRISKLILMKSHLTHCSREETASSEVKALDNFFTMLQTEPNRVYYG